MGRKQTFDNIDDIVDCAFDLISREGFSSFSTRKLASSLGISKNTAYNYLKNKEDIIFRVVEKAKKIFYENTYELARDRHCSTVDALDLILLFAEVLYDFMISYRDIYKLAYREMSVCYEKGASLEERFMFFIPLFRHFIRDFDIVTNEDFAREEFISKFHFLETLINGLVTIELNRTEKIGKESYMGEVANAWQLITGKEIPSCFF